MLNLNNQCSNCTKNISYKQWNITERNFGQGMCKKCELDWKADRPDKYPPKMVEFEKQQYQEWLKKNALLV